MAASSSYRVMSVRLWLFFAWVCIAFCYVAFFLIIGRAKTGVDPAECRNAVWQIVYITLPVLSAFASFWFKPHSGTFEAEHDRVGAKVRKDRVIAMFVLTAFVHGVVWLYWIINIALSDLPQFPADDQSSFEEVVRGGMNLLVFLSSIAILPVGYLTQVDVRLPNGGKTNGV